MAFDLQQHINDYWFTGQWHLMEQACRARLEQAPGDLDAAFALAETCHGLGRRDEAAMLLRRYADAGEEARFAARLSWLLQEAGELDDAIAAFREALAIDRACPLAAPHFDALLGVRDQIDDALARQFSNDTPTGACMLIHPAGAGFWSEVHHVLGHALAAEIDGRRPWVHWGETSVFASDPNQNAWLDFFEPLTPVDHLEIETAAAQAVFPEVWTGTSPYRDLQAKRNAGGPISAADLMARPHPLVVGTTFTSAHLVRHLAPFDHPFANASTGAILRELTTRCLRPAKHLAERAADFVAKQFGGSPFIAAHVRGTDKRQEQGVQLDAVNRAIGISVDRLMAERESIRLLLMTEDRDVEEHYRARFGSRVAVSTALRGHGAQAVHIGSGLPPRQLGEEVLVDVLMALAADRFVGNRFSNVACFVRTLKSWPTGTIHMIGTDDAVCNYAASVYRR